MHEIGVFTLRDMYEQLSNILNMGPLGKVMGMIPGIPPELLAGTEEEGTKRLRKFLAIMDSMTSQGEIILLFPQRARLNR
jgi:signal recognition particle subunit SRP54